MGQELNGSLGSWVTLSDPFPALVSRIAKCGGNVPSCEGRLESHGEYD